MQIQIICNDLDNLFVSKVYLGNWEEEAEQAPIDQLPKGAVASTECPQPVEELQSARNHVTDDSPQHVVPAIT